MQTIQQQFNNVARSAWDGVARKVWEQHAQSLGIPWQNFLRAYQIDHDILRSFNGQGRWLVIPNEDASGWNNRITLNVTIAEVGKVVMTLQRLDSVDNWLFITANGGTPCCGIGYNDIGATFSPTLGDLLTPTEQTVTFSNTSTTNLSLFSYGSNSHWSSKCQCQKAEIYGTDGTLLMYLVPFKQDGICYMRDLLNNVNYANTGSGTFTIEE